MILFDETIDQERDVHAVLVALPDYNGSPVATLFVTGYPVLYCEIKEDRYAFRHLGAAYDADDFSPHEQAIAAFYYHIGEVPDDQYQRYVNSSGQEPDLDGLLEYCDGHPLCEWQEKIEQALYRIYSTPAPEE